MNKTNILALATALETHALPALGFNMRRWSGPSEKTDPTNGEVDFSGHDCGTVACLAGWAYELAAQQDARVRRQPIMESAQHWLGLDNSTAMNLFIPYMNGAAEAEYPCLSAYDSTPAQAARVLRHLAATGRVEWSMALAAEPTSA